LGNLIPTDLLPYQFFLEGLHGYVIEVSFELLARRLVPSSTLHMFAWLSQVKALKVNTWKGLKNTKLKKQ
jgi:hypothetical protein